MFQIPLPVEYTRLSSEDLGARIGARRRQLGDRLLILGHHYQREEIICWADYRGDSLKLSQLAAASPDRPYVVFCGVHFMAESADILTTDAQTVILPNMSAGCSMADMANIGQVEDAWRTMSVVSGRMLPVTYVNSAANLKAFVGTKGGACCTSGNARKVLEWSLSQSDRVFFFPDQHLGRNTAVDMGMDPETDMLLWDPQAPCGGHDPRDLARKVGRCRIVLWKGHCSVHQRFTVQQIADARQRDPSVHVMVHPECELAVVQAADLAGSTEQIIAAVSQSAPGSVWAIGTEINLVTRLQAQMPNRTIYCLDPVVCPCSTMYRIHPRYLLWVLDNLAGGTVVNQVLVPDVVKQDAKLSLERMLSLS